MNIPTVTVSPEGRTVTLTCSGAPLGYAGTTSFLVETITDPVAETTTSMSAQLNMNSSYYTKKVSCKLATFMTVTFAESAKVDLPSEDTGITVSSVSATVTDAGGNVINLDTDYQIGAAEPTVTCQTSPAPESLDPSKNLIYQFFNPYSATSVQTGNSKTYKVPTSEPGELTYTCSATYGTNAAVTSSATIRIKVKSDSFVTAHDLTKVSPDVLNIGSTLILSCGRTLDASRTYTWSFNNQLIDGQADWKIQLYNFMEIDIGWYTCRATKVGFKAEESFIVAIMKPYIARVPAGDFFGQYGVYDLKCIIGSSENTGWTFSWKKDKDVTLIATDTYPIINATSATHDGTYTCTAIYNGVSSNTDEFSVAIVGK
ncbi:uncharacterized protein LOC131950383 [Physella acuta]|uniref:uncharacterized protein LOC131950383 n=1 Tax=Physella acuta TaxID=109671 RepID=UPI0027DBDB0F|nr:uncharacterized protein LOC131950383 [Physella acuta]